jgi:hypothetical protein
MQQFINRRKKWITGNLHRNEVNKLGYFPAYYLHKIKKIPKSVEKYSVYNYYSNKMHTFFIIKITRYYNL